MINRPLHLSTSPLIGSSHYKSIVNQRTDNRNLYNDACNVALLQVALRQRCWKNVYQSSVGEGNDVACLLWPHPASFALLKFLVSPNNFKTRQELQISGKDKVAWPEFHQSKFPRNQGLGLLLALCDLQGKEEEQEAIWRSSGKRSGPRLVTLQTCTDQPKFT